MLAEAIDRCLGIQAEDSDNLNWNGDKRLREPLYLQSHLYPHNYTDTYTDTYTCTDIYTDTERWQLLNWRPKPKTATIRAGIVTTSAGTLLLPATWYPNLYATCRTSIAQRIQKRILTIRISLGTIT